jgi:hypothetical protein
MGDDGERMLGGLLEISHLITVEELARVVAHHAEPAGLSQILIYVSCLQQQYLIPLPGQVDENGAVPEPLRVDTTLAGRAFRQVEVVTSSHALPPHGEGVRRLWVPMLDGTERIGVLGVAVPPHGGEDAERRARNLASLLAVLLVSKSTHSDSFSRMVRVRPMSLSAEVLLNLLPPGTVATRDVVKLNVAIFDSMGHDIAAGLTATIATGAFRNNRLQGADLPAAGEAIDAAIAEQFTGRFTTGVMAELNLRTGWLNWVNRGHPAPLVLRDGRCVAVLEAEPDPVTGWCSTQMGSSRRKARTGSCSGWSASSTSSSATRPTASPPLRRCAS